MPRIFRCLSVIYIKEQKKMKGTTTKKKTTEKPCRRGWSCRENTRHKLFSLGHKARHNFRTQPSGRDTDNLMVIPIIFSHKSIISGVMDKINGFFLSLGNTFYSSKNP